MQGWLGRQLQTRHVLRGPASTWAVAYFCMQEAYFLLHTAYCMPLHRAIYSAAGIMLSSHDPCVSVSQPRLATVHTKTTHDAFYSDLHVYVGASAGSSTPSDTGLHSSHSLPRFLLSAADVLTPPLRLSAPLLPRQLPLGMRLPSSPLQISHLVPCRRWPTDDSDGLAVSGANWLVSSPPPDAIFSLLGGDPEDQNAKTAAATTPQLNRSSGSGFQTTAGL